MIASISQEPHLGAGTVLGRRPAFQHGERRTRSFRPFLAFRLGRSAPALERALDEVHALVKPVAAEIDVRGVTPDRSDPVIGADHVAAADLEWIDSELFCQIVECALDGEGGLRGTVATKAAARQQVGVNGIAVGLLVRAAIGRERAGECRCQRLAAMAAIGTGVGDNPDLDCRKRAVGSYAEPY